MGNCEKKQKRDRLSKREKNSVASPAGGGRKRLHKRVVNLERKMRVLWCGMSVLAQLE